ncbi:META domain-containing protein [Streptomyces sp. NPDC086989]|uniref:META domain-containing protein n=1 Tax=Streptomyces sp. NPDC086989 TaxID=3365764 RepID=UPI0037F7B6D1
MPTLRRVPPGLALASALALALTACSGAGKGESGTLPDPKGSWAVESLTTGGRTLHAPENARVDLTDKDATGNYGCNGFTAGVAFSGTSAVTVTPGTTSLRSCPAMEFEKEFSRLFKGRLAIDRGPDRLTLKTSDGSTIAMSTKPPVPNAPFHDTWWTVESLVTGDTAAPLPAEAAGKARFRLSAGLAASGSLGCNRFSAQATGDGAQLTFGALTTTRMACEGAVGEVERKLTELFAADPLTWDIEGRTLTLTAPDGRGLVAQGASATE